MSFIAMETQNPLGQRPLNLMSRSQGLGWLGAAPTPGDYDNNQQVLGQLVAMGAISQDDANNIWAGTASLDDMPVNMTMINQALALTGQQGAQVVQPLPPSSPSTPSGTLTVVPYTATPSTPILPTAVTAAAAAATPAAAAQIPPGSIILYSATFNPVKSFITASTVISDIAAQLPAHGMSMISSSVQQSGITSTGMFTMTIMDSGGNALQSDAKSVLDALVNQFTANGLMQSTIAVTAAGTASAAAAAAGAAPNLTSWMEQNVGLLVGLVLAVVIVPPLIKKL